MQQEEQSSVHLSLKLSSVTSVIYQPNSQSSLSLVAQSNSDSN